MFQRIALRAVLGAFIVTLLATTAVLGHEEREVGEYTLVVGFLDEPVYSGEKSGLDLRVSRGEEPVEGVEETLAAEVTFGGSTRELALSPAFGRRERVGRY